MEAFVPSSTFLGTRPLSSRYRSVSSRCHTHTKIVCAKKRKPSPPGKRKSSTRKGPSKQPDPVKEPAPSKEPVPLKKPASSVSSSFAGMAAGPGAPAKSQGIGSIGKKKNLVPKPQEPKAEDAEADVPKSDEVTPEETAPEEREIVAEVIESDTKSERRAVRALGQKKSRPLPAIQKKTASDFIAEGVVDDVDEDLNDFIEADIRYGIADVSDPFKRDAEATEQEKVKQETEKVLATVGKTLDVSGDAGVSKRLITPGSGEVVNKGATVTVEYTGKLADGTTFDSSRTRTGGFSFELGAGKVIKGWEAGVATMRVGEVSEFTISPEYAYGRRGMPPVIPGSSTLTFEVELLKAEGGERFEIKKMADFNPDVARTPQEIAREYDELLETQEERKKGMSLFDRFYIISPFASQTGERPPWWLNPSITFVGVFALCGLAFYLVVIAGGIHIGYVDQPVDVNIFK